MQGLLLSSTLLLSAFLASTSAQMIPQCLCSDVDPCLAKATDLIMSCADKCQSNFAAVGGNYPAVRQCLSAHAGSISKAVTCTRASFGQSCAAGPGQTVPKRYPETIQLAAFKEIQQVLTRSGVASQATGLLQVGRKAAGCILKCLQSSTQSCFKAGCGVALPTDNVIVSNAKGCFISSGLNTPALRSLCSCLGGAGIKALTPICGALTIS